MPVCFYYWSLQDTWVEETVFVLTNGKDQGAAVSNAAIKAAIKRLIDQGKLKAGELTQR